MVAGVLEIERDSNLRASAPRARPTAHPEGHDLIVIFDFHFLSYFPARKWPCPHMGAIRDEDFAEKPSRRAYIRDYCYRPHHSKRFTSTIAMVLERHTCDSSRQQQ
jgi:hypothetical protein